MESTAVFGVKPHPMPLPVPPRPRASLPELPGLRVSKLLGRGGMGVVYLAEQTGLGRAVAVKMLPPDSPEWAKPRFRSEAEAVASLDHPNVVRVFGTGDSRFGPYLIMEYLEGGSLDARLDGSPWKPTDSAQLMLPLARGMAHAHEAGLIHRDIKPSNILLESPDDSDLSPKISDFGLAKFLASSPELTKTGCVMGTPGYMAPEQASGRTRDVGAASDVYALGAMLYELLTGQPPFRGLTPADIVLQLIRTDPIPPRRLQPSVPKDLETICLKCLEKNPRKRYPDAGALAEDLDAFLSQRMISARPVGPAGKATRWVARNRSLASALGVLTLTVVAAFCVVLWQWQRAVDARTDAQGWASAEESARKSAELREQEALEAEQEAGRQRLLAEGQKSVMAAAGAAR